MSHFHLHPPSTTPRGSHHARSHGILADSGGHDVARLVKIATWCSVGAATFLVLIKTAAWWMTDSLSMLTTLIDSLLDIMASIVNFLAVRFALRPPDAEHRFGHGKIEEIATLAQSTFIGGSAVYIFFEGARRLFRPEPLSEEPVGMAVMVISIFVTAGLVIFQRRVTKRTGSHVIHADALHYFTDFLTNIGVLLALAASHWWGWQRLDAGLALLISFYILYGAWVIGHRAFNNLLDREFDDAEREKIKTIIRSHPEVLGIHELRTRRGGLYGFIQFHLELDGAMTLNESHRIVDQIEEALMTAFPRTEVLIHQDCRPAA